jgi:hypothetical protein
MHPEILFLCRPLLGLLTRNPGCRLSVTDFERNYSAGKEQRPESVPLIPPDVAELIASVREAMQTGPRQQLDQLADLHFGDVGPDSGGQPLFTLCNERSHFPSGSEGGDA